MLENTDDIDSHWNACAEEIRKAASEVLGKQEPTRPKGWRDAEYDMTAATKDEDYRQWLQRKTRASLKEYRSLPS